MNSLLLVFYVLHMLCVYINTMPKKTKHTFSDSWSNPIRHWKGWRQLQNGDVPGGIQRSLLQPAGTEWCPSFPENVWTLYMLKFALIWKADGGCGPNVSKGSLFPVLIRRNAAAVMKILCVESVLHHRDARWCLLWEQRPAYWQLQLW